jgi:hypothetical protein
MTDFHTTGGPKMTEEDIRELLQRLRALDRQGKAPPTSRREQTIAEKTHNMVWLLFWGQIGLAVLSLVIVGMLMHVHKELDQLWLGLYQLRRFFGIR